MPGPICYQARQAGRRLEQHVTHATAALGSREQVAGGQRMAQAVSRLADLYTSERRRLPADGCGGRCLEAMAGRALVRLLATGGDQRSLTAGQAIELLRVLAPAVEAPALQPAPPDARRTSTGVHK
jgi:hypothetical protein